jgi:Uncharacterised nucleotidyltransferase
MVDGIVSELVLAQLAESSLIFERQTTALIEAGSSLQNQGIPVMVLKGHALATMLFAERRPYKRMNDVDIMVPEEHFDRAIDLLLSSGFSCEYAPSKLHRDKLVHHYVPLVHWNGAHLDLHWNITGRHGFRVQARDLWKRAVPLDILGASFLRLTDVDFMNHLLIHYHFYRAKISDTMDLVNAFEYFANRSPTFVEELRAVGVTAVAQSAHYRASWSASAVAPRSSIAKFATSLNANWFWKREIRSRVADPVFTYAERRNFFGKVEASLNNALNESGMKRLEALVSSGCQLLFPSHMDLRVLENRQTVENVVGARIVHLLRVFHYYRHVI